MTEYKLTLIEKIRKFFGLDSNYYNDLHQLHREDGPAYIYPDGTPDGTQFWYLNGKYHREDGPAVIYSNGTKVWYLNGKRITDEVNQWFEECNLTYETMEFEDKMALKFYIRGLAT